MINHLPLKIVDIIESITGKGTAENPIPLHEPDFTNSNATEYLNNCITSGWVSTAGEWVNKFEKELANLTKAKHAIVVSNGTVALRLALKLKGVKANEEVIIPPLSFIASANAVSHLGAIPHFVDIELDTLGISPEALIKRLDECSVLKDGKVFNKNTNRKISAIMAVHIFGHPSRVDELRKIASVWNIPLIEDCAEALGSYRYDENSIKHCGLFGEIGTLSFNGNKIITTGGGGALLTNNSDIAKKARHLSTTAKKNHKWEFEHDEIGWNDRLPNINAALGVSQIEQLQKKLKTKYTLNQIYTKAFENLEELYTLNQPELCKSNFWLNNIILKERNDSTLKEIRNKILELSHQKFIYTRPVWKLLSKQKPYIKSPKGDLTNSEFIEFRIISLPSSTKIYS